MTLDDLCARRVAIWGVGEEGLSMARLLIDRGATPLLIDDRPRADIDQVTDQLGAGLHAVDPGQVSWEAVDVVVRSPGVSRYRSELADAESKGVSVTTAMAVWLEDVGGVSVLAVTGTKGKSTTAALAAAILEGAGLSVALVGNIGTAVTELYRQPAMDAYVVEVSSYQAADVHVSPEVCVLTALAPDHLDWHGGIETYYRDKLRLIRAGPLGSVKVAVNAGDSEAMVRTADLPGRLLFGPQGAVRLEPSGVISVNGEPLVDAGRLQVPGLHNVFNLCGAIAGCLLLRGTSPLADSVGAVVDDFEGLPSRCRIVGKRNGITYVDDALASNPFAAGASVTAFPGGPLTVIVGGADRGVEPGPLVDALSGRGAATRVVVLPPEPERWVGALVGAVGLRDIVVARDLVDAVRLAVVATPVGGTVLFSPAAPTPAGEGGYRNRSQQFVEAAGLSELPEPD
jgi:UDP-N-acetylmuramoyl-L-alanine---L-glutamate ligase